MGVFVYITSASGSTAIKKQCQAILDCLDAKHIAYETIDLAQEPDAKDAMRSKVPPEIKKKFEEAKKTILPPQVFNEDHYCGDYNMFFNAKESELICTFFKVEPDADESAKMKTINWEKELKKADETVGDNTATEENAEKGESNDAKQKVSEAQEVEKKEIGDAEQTKGQEVKNIEGLQNSEAKPESTDANEKAIGRQDVSKSIDAEPGATKVEQSMGESDEAGPESTDANQAEKTDVRESSDAEPASKEPKQPEKESDDAEQETSQE